MSRPQSSARVVLRGLTMLSLACPMTITFAQARPAGDHRLWVEIGVAAARQMRRCLSCNESASVGGASVTAAAGSTLLQGFGVALLGRAFQELGLDSWLKSRYVVSLCQYTPRAMSLMTINAGAGWGRHSAEPSSAGSSGAGAIIYAGTALRVPPRGTFALSVTADVIQSISGTPDSHPRLLSIGVAIGAATAGAKRH